MSYTKRVDGRAFDELRPMSVKVGVLENALGSCLFQMGKTKVLAGVYGPRQLYPRFLRNPEKGTVRCFYNMYSFSVSDRKRPGPGRREKELSEKIAQALEPAVMLEKFPDAVVDVFVEIIQADAGTRCASICAASTALADAGMPMKDIVSSVAMGKIGDKICADIDKYEEDYEGGATDIPIAFMPRTGEITLLQLDGEISPEDLKKAISVGREKVKEIYEKQKEALTAKYKGDKQ
ncbi:MAG: exosome complex exonuclease Rrp41 [Candidatus Nanoarchaeia archaeon]|nr:exosome complex exonuclease Rrp41 [Candidatus Nanoarchaeia archaeon]